MQVQLAKTYSPARNYGVSSWWASPKMDGIRALYIQGRGLVSRTQKTIFVGLQHIEAICEQMVAAAGEPIVVDGELFIPDESFDVASGIIRDRKGYDPGQKARVQFHVFGIWKASGWADTQQMVNAIAALVPNQPFVIPAPYALIENDPVVVQERKEIFSTISIEGIMLRHPQLAYVEGRTDALLKVKRFESAVFTVSQIHQGSGRLRGSMGKVTVTGEFQGFSVESNVGTGFTDAQRQEIWNNQQQFLGSSARIIFMGLSSSRTKLTKSLRIAVFKEFM